MSMSSSSSSSASAKFKTIILKNAHNTIAFGLVEKDEQDRTTCSFYKPVKIDKFILKLSCIYKHLNHPVITDLQIVELECIGHFDETIKDISLKNIKKFDFSKLFVPPNKQTEFLTFLKTHLPYEVYGLSLPRLTDLNLAEFTEWLCAINLNGFTYDLDPNNKIQSVIVKLVNKGVVTCPTMTDVFLKSSKTPIFNTSEVEYKESRYDEGKDLIVAMYQPIRNIMTIKFETSQKNYHLNMSQLELFKKQELKERHFKVYGDYVNSNVALIAQSLDFGNISLPDNKLSEFLEWLIKQKVSYLTLPKLKEFTFTNVYTAIMKIEGLTNLSIKDSKTNKELSSLQLVVNYDLTIRNNHSEIEQIKKRNKISDDAK